MLDADLPDGDGGVPDRRRVQGDKALRQKLDAFVAAWRDGPGSSNSWDGVRASALHEELERLTGDRKSVV